MREPGGVVRRNPPPGQKKEQVKEQKGESDGELANTSEGGLGTSQSRLSPDPLQEVIRRPGKKHQEGDRS